MNTPTDPNCAYCAEGSPLDAFGIRTASCPPPSTTSFSASTFAAADQIVVAAPFWDLSFPALLKTYVEWISVIGVVFRYSDDGRPIGLCRARRLFYVGTSGGPAETDPFGFGYVEALAKNFWGIPEVRRIAATGLDIVGADVEAILRSAEEEIDKVRP